MGGAGAVYVSLTGAEFCGSILSRSESDFPNQKISDPDPGLSKYLAENFFAVFYTFFQDKGKIHRF
jgi:hypothetical protein